MHHTVSSGSAKQDKMHVNGSLQALPATSDVGVIYCDSC